MIKDIRWSIYGVVLCLILLPMVGSYYALRTITDSASSIGLSPTIVEELQNSSVHLKDLAKLDPTHADAYRAEFNQLQDTKLGYQTLLELRPTLDRSYLEVYFIVFGVSLLVALILATWLNRRIIRTHDLALRGIKAAEERNLYLENREAWRLVAQKFVHEVKNPLTPLNMMVGHVLSKYDALPGPNTEFKNVLTETRDMVLEETSKIARWVEAFSKFAQIPDAQNVTMNLSEILGGFSVRYAEQWPNLSFKLLLVDAQDLEARGDPVLFKQVLFNVAKNAAEAAGNQRVELAISSESTSNGVKVKLEDNGPGLSESLKTTLFRPYHSSKGKSGGMGLGLAICKKIMLEQGGDIRLLPSEQGCVFELMLPRSMS
jgi:signal transduction histidine kinase